MLVFEPLVALLVQKCGLIAIAAYQRGYFTNAERNCASAGTIAVTVIAGPLNYVGVNPKVTNCNVPQSSDRAHRMSPGVLAEIPHLMAGSVYRLAGAGGGSAEGVCGGVVVA